MKYIISLLFNLFLFFTCTIPACKIQETPTLITSAISNISTSSALGGGTITNEGSDNIIERGVCWSINTAPKISENKTLDGTGTGSFSSIINGLSASTTYYVRAYATNNVGTSYGDEKTFITKATDTPLGSQLIADHHAVANFDKIPANWIAEVKKMHVYFPGASHSDAYRGGLTRLESVDPIYAVEVATAQSYTAEFLRSNQNPSGYVDEDVWLSWWDYAEGSRPASSFWITNLIQSYHNNGYPLDILGFGWCWDMVGGFPSGSVDPVTGNRWYGTSIGGIDGDNAWGIDDSDDALTGNRVNLQDYFNITESFNEYCISHGIKTKAIYTTGPLISTIEVEALYSAQLKHDEIRSWVARDPSRILLDYADILAYDDGSQVESTGSWNGHSFQITTAANEGEGDIGHISSIGAIRLAKAQWWLLARLAGWDGK